MGITAVRRPTSPACAVGGRSSRQSSSYLLLVRPAGFVLNSAPLLTPEYEQPLGTPCWFGFGFGFGFGL